MSKTIVEVPGSHHRAPAMRALGRVPEDEPITVSLYLRPSAGEIASGSGQVTRDLLRERRVEAHAADMSMVAVFAHEHALEVVLQDATRRLVQLRGSAQALESAFGTQLQHFEADDGAVYRGREGALHVPAELEQRVTAVLGLETTPIATPKFVRKHGAVQSKGFLPTEVAALYGFTGLDASGQCVAIIELGGGYNAKDNVAAFKAMKLPVPEIVAVGVDGGSNNPQDGSGANGEVALDIQVVGGLAPNAKIAVYFAPNTSQGFADAISQAVHDQTNSPSVGAVSLMRTALSTMDVGL